MRYTWNEAKEALTEILGRTPTDAEILKFYNAQY